MAIDLNLLRFHLEQERIRLTELLEKTRTSKVSTNESKGSWFGQRDEQSTEAAEMRRQLSSEETLSDLLAQIEHALQKSNDGTYGLCDNCGLPIDPARLEALPYANLCLNCKAIKEK